MLFEIVSTLSAGPFAGAATYINLVEQPARVECGVELALREFDNSSELASVLLARWAKLHAVRSVLGLIAFLIFIVLLARGGLK